MTDVKKLKADLMRKRKLDVIRDSDYLSTGSTLLNLACTGRVEGGFVKGSYVFFVGDSDSGKTFVGLSCLAEACINKHFDDYRIIYDAVERKSLINIRKFFGDRTAERLEPPAVDGEGRPVYSDTVESFYFHLDDAVQDGRPFIFLLDSQDSLSSMAESDKFDERKEAYGRGRETAGSYGDGKAKVHSSTIRKFIKPLERMGSILVVLNQTRDSFSLFERSTHSGGRALKFYATLQLWSSVKGKIERQVKGKKRQLGVNCKVQVKKNHIVGWDRTVIVPVYHSHGIDDTGSMVGYLVDEGVWKKKGAKVEATGLGPAFVDTVEKVVQRIEAGDMVEDLRELVGQTWAAVERACEVKRMRRYE